MVFQEKLSVIPYLTYSSGIPSPSHSCWFVYPNDMMHPALRIERVVLRAFTSNGATHTMSKFLFLFPHTEMYDEGEL
jgi:hypothetical protein